MKAAVLHEVNKPLAIEDVSVPNPGPREVLIRTKVAGLCHSDLHFIEGLYPHPLPAVLGHESAGIVEKVGSDVTYVKPGDHVVTCLSVFCGTCDNCTTGRTVLCTDTTVKMLPGQSNRLSWSKPEKLNQFLNLSSFAEQMLVHENAIVKIKKEMPLELAALIGCGVITGYGAVVNTAKVTAGETVAVVGCGGVGMAAINGAAIAGAGRIIAIDTNPAKLQLATKLGATDIVDPRNGDLVQPRNPYSRSWLWILRCAIAHHSSRFTRPGMTSILTATRAPTPRATCRPAAPSNRYSARGPLGRRAWCSWSARG